MNLDYRSGEAHLSARRKREYTSLSRSKGRRDLGQYLVEGVRALESARDAGVKMVDVVVSGDAAADPRVAQLLGSLACPVLLASAREVEQIADVRTSQGIVGAAVLPEPIARTMRCPCLLLDGVQDPGNVGALIRTAAWYGVHTVVCGPGTADPYQPKVVRASMGGLWDVAIERVEDLEGFYRALEVPVYVADAGGEAAGDWEPAAQAILVVGSEGHGPSPVSLAAAHRLVSLGRAGEGRGTESLNASVAGGILLDRWLGRGSDSDR